MSKKNNKENRSFNANTLANQLGNALHTILKKGGKVVLEVRRNKVDPWEGLEEEPEIPDWLRK